MYEIVCKVDQSTLCSPVLNISSTIPSFVGKVRLLSEKSNFCQKSPTFLIKVRTLTEKYVVSVCVCQRNYLSISEFSNWESPLGLHHALKGVDFFDNPSNNVSLHGSAYFLAYLYLMTKPQVRLDL
jgi:hypothetical protein